MENNTTKKRGGQAGHKGGTGRPPKPDPKLRQDQRVTFCLDSYQYEQALEKTPSGNVNEFARCVLLQNM